MVSPAFRAAATTTGATATSITITKPAGVVADDILVATIYQEEDPAYSAWTAPSGWTEVGSRITNTGTTPDAHIRKYYKRAGGSEPANYAWSWTPSLWTMGGIVAYSGAITSGDPHDVVGSSNTGLSTAPSALGVTTTVADTLLVAHFGFGFGDAWTAPAGMSQAFSVGDPNVVQDYQAFVGPGATGAKTGSLATDQNWMARLTALKPPGAARLTRWLPSPRHGASTHRGRARRSV